MMGEMVARIDVLLSLRKLKAVLTKHLKLEDVSLYPKLNQAENKKAKETAKKFSDEMLEISKVVFDFFDRYIRLKVFQLETNQKFKKELKEITSIVTMLYQQLYWRIWKKGIAMKKVKQIVKQTSTNIDKPVNSS